MPDKIEAVFGIVLIALLSLIAYFLWRSMRYIRQIIKLDKEMLKRIDTLLRKVK